MIAPVISQAQLNRRQTPKAQTASVPAPIGGLNARDPLAEMPPTDAIILDNWFPSPNGVGVRNGYALQATGFAAPVQSVMGYNGISTNKLFAAAGGNIYDITSTAGGAIGAPVVSGLGNAQFQCANYATGGTNYLYVVNGHDDAQLFNGSTWQDVNSSSSPIAITGASTSNFVNVNVYAQRLFFIAKNSSGFYYLAPNAIGGAASFFDLGPLMRLGGSIVGMLTWSVDNAAGIQQYAVFISDQGECFIYQGYDPTQASTWNLVSTFRIGRPVGYRFFAKMGSDYALLTVDGVIPLSKALLTDRAQEQIALTDKIRTAIQSDVLTYKGNFGWQLILHPAGQKLIVNVPVVPNSVTYQYVMNTITGSWCTFGKNNSAWNANCFEYWQDALYFGGSNFVGIGDSGGSDNGAAILADVKQAFNYFGVQGLNKQFTMVRPNVLTNGQITMAIDLNMDFEDRAPTSTPSFSLSGSPWNTSPWNTSPWTTGNQLVHDWESVLGLGYCASLRMRAQVSNILLQWQSTDYVFQVGGIL